MGEVFGCTGEVFGRTGKVLNPEFCSRFRRYQAASSIQVPCCGDRIEEIMGVYFDVEYDQDEQQDGPGGMPGDGG